MAGEPDYTDNPVQGPTPGDISSVNMVASPTIPVPPPLEAADVTYGGPFLHIEEAESWQAQHTDGTYPPGVYDHWRPEA